MTLLSIARSVTGSIGLTRPVAVASSNDPLAVMLYELANTTLEELGRMNWPSLDTAYSFPTVVNQTAYAMPPDYGRFQTDTAYVSSTYYQLRGSLSAREWAIRRNGFSQLPNYMRYRVFGYPLKINLVPAPQKVETMTIEYVSKYLAIGYDNVRKALYQTDTDVSVVPEELVQKGLKWRLKHAKGLDYSQDFNDYETARYEVLSQALNLPSIPVAWRWPYADEYSDTGFPFIPDTGFGP